MEDNTVPVAFVVMHEGSLFTGPVSFEGGRLSVEPAEKVISMQSLRGGKVRGKALLIDAESLNSGSFNPPVVSHAKLTGTDMWLAECIADLEDLADAFLGGMQKLVVPLHALRSPEMLVNIAFASDACIPMLVCAGGRSIDGKDIFAEAERARDVGYSNLIVFDADGSVPGEVLREVASIIPGMGVLAHYGPSPVGGITFRCLFDYSVL